MAGAIEDRLRQRGIELPQAGRPTAAYVPTVQSGNMLYVSGQVPVWNGEFRYKGKLGQDVSLEDGRQAARLCALNILAQAQAALGTLDRVARVVKVVGFVNATPDFADQPKVINGASELLEEVFGENGRHARSAVGMGSLPLGVAVEVEAILELA